MSALKPKFAPGLVPQSLVGVAGGLATLDSNSYIPSQNINPALLGGTGPKGTYDATTALPTSPKNGDLYLVSAAGNAGNFTTPLAVGDYIIYSTALSAWEPIYAPRTTDQLTEGSTNLFFTTVRAQTAAVVNTLSGGQTVQAPSVASVVTALAAKANSFTRAKQRFVLASGDITNGYVLLSNLAQALSLIVGVQGCGLLEEQTSGSTGDYTATTSGSVTKLSWLNDFVSGGASPLAVGDVIYAQYVY